MGAVPPPVHGMALAFAAVVKRLRAEGFDVAVFDVSAADGRRSAVAHVRKFWRYVAIAASLLRAGGGAADVLYICISGGYGLLFDILLLAVCRAAGIRIFIHHHSFAYLNAWRWDARLAFFCAGQAARHIGLRAEMATALTRVYGIPADRILNLSNSWFVPNSPQTRDGALRCVGFLSNLAPGKGLDVVLRVAAGLVAQKSPLRVLVAGPCTEPALQRQIQSARDSGLVEWLGPVYGQAKQDFFESIDVFLFPTRYANEAEPLVIWEALMAGAPVIAYRRGCIAGQVADAGIVVDPQEDFAAQAMDVLKRWTCQKDVFQKFVAAALARAADEAAATAAAWARFATLLRGGV